MGPTSIWRYGPPLALILVGCAVYANSLDNPFFFDDLFYIVDNPDIRELWPLWQSPLESTWPALNARPLVRFTLAGNYALGGLAPRGYHLVNLGIHLACALSIYGLARHTLATTRFARDAFALALAIAMIWTVHPVNSECINYLSQRSESLLALFYLLTLYCVLRSRLSTNSAPWNLAAIACAALGAASKEVMATAPIVVLLFEWTFCAGSFAEILKNRWRLYAGLIASCWLLFAALSLSSPHGQSIGVSAGVSAWDYLINQAWIVTRYLQLCFWPAPLIFDYGYPMALSLGDVWGRFLLLSGLLTASGIALYYRQAVGFLGLAFFIILAPTSSIIPIINEVGAERRLYLPLVAVVALSVLTVYQLSQRFIPRPTTTTVGLTVALTVVAALGWTTIERNRDYRSPEAIWSTVAAALPDNPRAYSGLAHASERAGDVEKAVQLYERALALTPEFFEYIRLHRHIATLLINNGDPAGAADYYRRIIAERPADAPAQRELAYALGRAGDTAAAITHYLRALAMGVDSFDLHYDLAAQFYRTGDYAQAEAHYRQASQLNPTYAPAFNNLGTALAAQSRFADAIEQFAHALALNPNYAQARANLATARAAMDRAAIDATARAATDTTDR